ncbi:hypothetical protein FBU31_000827 [Coemansia sp. 'formosensis']|nr:hypothetical protein FBU31_000827 [Coemansia sp. 'formosensis']
MVCSICQDSYFKAPVVQRGGRRSTNASAGGSTAHRPAALGCGNAFHKVCIEQWFDNDNSKSCPQCKVSHRGPVTMLYIDMDEEDYKASRRSQSSSNRNEGEMRQLAQGMLSMNIQDKSAEYFMIADLLRQNRELISGTNGRMREELAEAKRQLREGRWCSG